MCVERTQSWMTKPTNCSIFQSLDRRAKKKPRIDVDSDIEISNDEEREQ